MNIVNHSDPAADVREKFTYRHSWSQLIRSKTLTGTVSPLIAGTIIAAKEGAIRIDLFIALIVAAILVQAATNILNDYFDFKSGQDVEKWASPADEKFDQGPVHHTLPFTAAILLATAVLIGAWIASQSGWWIVIVGTISILAGYAYSAGPRSLSARGLGEFTAAIFLGPVVTVLGYSVQGHPPNTIIFAISIPFALLISVMILANNIRDIEKDKPFRRTLVYRIGRVKASYLLTVLLSLTYSWIILLVLIQAIPWTTLLSLLALPVAYKLNENLRPGAKRADEIASMSIAANHHWVFSILFLIGLLLNGFQL